MSRCRPVFLLPVLMLSCLSAMSTTTADAAARPNIVIIMADDMGISDIGCQGSEIRTPNLDRLASEGLRFTQFYNGARCCPTRAALLTGLYAHQAGVGHMVESRPHPSYQGYLNDRCVTIGEVLRGAGYRTYHVGKWHVGENRPHWPFDRGFDRSYALISGATNYFRLDPDRKMAIDDKPFTPPSEGYYITDAFSDNAARFIEEHGRGDAPFFLYLAYTAPHWPLHALSEDVARYRGKYREGWDALREKRYRRMIELGLIDSKQPLSPPDKAAKTWVDLSDAERDEFDLRMAVYAAQIDRMDQGIGKVVAKIAELGLEENTLVLFLADNGGCAEEVDRGKPGVPAGDADSFKSYGLSWANASNTPFRRYKHWVHEGGISSPLIAKWPAVIKSRNALTKAPAHLIDLMATCVDVSAATYPKSFGGKMIQPPEGLSLRPVFETGDRPGHDALYWEHEGNRAVRKGRWKLVSAFREPWELYDIESDRVESNNLAKARPELVRELAGLYDRWAERCGVRPWETLRSEPARKKARAQGGVSK